MLQSWLLFRNSPIMLPYINFIIISNYLKYKCSLFELCILLFEMHISILLYLMLDGLLLNITILMYRYLLNFQEFFKQPLFNIAIHVTIQRVVFNAIQVIIYHHQISALVFSLI
jgi:hypothetical protein